MRVTVTTREANQQLTRLMAVFPRHGLSDEGVMEYADSMTTIFAGEWHMRAVIDEAKRRFEFFPSIAQLVELADEVSAKRQRLDGCPKCIRSMPGMTYVQALWTPGSGGKSGKFEGISDEALETIERGLTATNKASQGQENQEVFTLPLQEIEEIVDGELKRLTVTNPKAKTACVVGYCDCTAGNTLRHSRLLEQAAKAEKKAARNSSELKQARQEVRV